MNTKLLQAGFAALCLAALPVADAQSGLDARIDLRIEQRPLGRVVDSIRSRTGANIIVSAEAADREVTSLDLNKVHWREALKIACENAGCVVEERAGNVLFVSVQVPVTIELVNRDLTEVIDTIGKLGGANIVWAPEVAGTVSLRLKDVPWRHALDVAVKTLGYVVVEEDGGILRVVDPVTLQAQMETRSYQLRYLRPRSIYRPDIKSEFLQPTSSVKQSSSSIQEKFTVLKALEKALSPGGELDYIESNNVVLVRDTAQVHKNIEEMLARLDIQPPSVFVDVKFVSTAVSNLLDLGVDYGDQGMSVSASGSAIPITLPFTEGQSLRNWLANPNGILTSDPAQNPGGTVIPNTVFGELSFTGVNPTLKLLQRDTDSEVIQAPKVIAVDGHEATIFVGETIRYAEAKSEQGQAGGLQLSLQEADNSPVNVGFQLLIIPHVVPGTNTVMMEVIPKETSLSGTGTSTLAPAGFDVFTIGAAGLEGSIALPRTRSSTIITTMLLEAGQTGVIGGLNSDIETTIVSKVPFMGDIPILGQLFKHRSKDLSRRNLLVFLTPAVVHSSQDTERILQQELDRRSEQVREKLRQVLYLDERTEPGDADGDFQEDPEPAAGPDQG